MSAAHILHCDETLIVEVDRVVPDPDRPGQTKTIPSFSWWEGGIGCQVQSPNRPGHVLKLLGGRGQHGSDNFSKGLKMMECSVISRFCHPPISSYLYGSGDVEIRNIRLVLFFIVFPVKEIVISSSFGKRFLHLLLEYCQSQCCPGFEADGELPELAWLMHQDLSFTFLVYSPRNVARHSHLHPHYREAYEIMQRNRMIHQFCTRCVSPKCIVNATMLRLIQILLYYLNEVIPVVLTAPLS